MQKNIKQEILRFFSKNPQTKELLSAAIFFLFAIIIFFYPIITKNKFFGGDFLFGFPQYFNMYANLKEFHIDNWNPYNLSGTPDIASNFMISYLPNWICALLTHSNISDSYFITELMIIFHFFLGSIFSYFLARYFKINFWGAIASGLIFSLSGYLTYKSMYFSLVYSTIWLPLIFLFYHKGLNQKKFRDIATASFFIAISALGSFQQITFYIGLFLFFYTLFYIYIERKQNPNKKKLSELFQLSLDPLLKLLFVAFITIGSIAITSMHMINYYSQTWHGSNSSIPIGTSLSPLNFLFTQIIPHYFGGYNQHEIYYGNWPIIELASYVGMIPLILAFITIIVLFLKNNTVKFLLITMVFFIMFAFGVNSPIYLFFYYLVPLFKNFSTPSRALLFFIFPVSLLAGYGITILSDEIKKDLKHKINMVINFLLAIFAVLGTIFAILSIFNSGNLVKKISLSYPGTNFINPSVIFNDYLVFITIILSAYLIFKKYLNNSIKKPIFILLIIIIIFLDLFNANSKFYGSGESINPKEYYEKTPVIDYLNKKDKTNFRIAVNNLENDSMDTLYKIPSTEQLTVANFRYEEYTKGNFSGFGGGMGIDSGNRLNLLNARYLMFDTPPQKGNYKKIDGVDRLYENIDALPRLFLVHETETAINPESILDRIDSADFNPRQTIILEKVSPLKNSSVDKPNNRDKAAFTYYSPDQIEIYTYSENPSMLFLSEMYYPGWKAFIDEKPAEIYQTNYLFRSVYLNKGPHAVKMVYNPEDVKLGRNITVTTLFILLLYFIIDIIRNRKLEKSF